MIIVFKLYEETVLGHSVINFKYLAIFRSFLRIPPSASMFLKIAISIAENEICQTLVSWSKTLGTRPTPIFLTQRVDTQLP